VRSPRRYPRIWGKARSGSEDSCRPGDRIDDFQAKRSPDERYRTAPLAGLWTHQKGGFYHDGRFATLSDVVDHYNARLELTLSEAERNDLVDYLKSIPGADTSNAGSRSR
jgi:cytochrome c peroxidase